MANMIGFRPPEDERWEEESRRGRSSRTGRYTRMDYDGEYESRERRYGDGERFERRGEYGRYDGDDREYRMRDYGYGDRRMGRERMEYGRSERESRRGIDDRDGYD